MEGMSRIERLYVLGEFQNIKIISEITQIPKEILLITTANELLTRLQLLQIERTYKNYVEIIKNMPKENSQEFITKEISNTLDELLTLLKQTQKTGE